MRVGFFDGVKSGLVNDEVFPSGYSVAEIELIEYLYKFRAVGMIRSFLSEMGRSAGGILTDAVSALYSPLYDLRSHILLQADFFRFMQEAENHDFLDSPFVFCVLSETQYCFVRTASKDHDFVYIFNSINGTVSGTNQKLDSFLRDLVCDQLEYGICRTEGDLLRVTVGGRWGSNGPFISIPE